MEKTELKWAFYKQNKISGISVNNESVFQNEADRKYVFKTELRIPERC